MKCSNCGAAIPRNLGACPECGVFARVVAPQKKKTKSWTWVVALLLLAAGVGAATFFLTRPKPRPRPVVQLPIRSGAVENEHDAVLRLRQTMPVDPQCLATVNKGLDGGAYHFVAFNRCDGTRLGKWLVDAKTGAVRAATP